MKKLSITLLLTCCICSCTNTPTDQAPTISPQTQVKHSIIVTGFGPFAGLSHNPAWTVVSQLPDAIDNVKIIKKKLPVEWIESHKDITSLVKDNKNALAIVSVGLDPRSSTNNIRIEQGAVNQAFGIDNSGKYEYGVIIKGGPKSLQLNTNALTPDLTLQQIVTDLQKTSNVKTIIPGTLKTAKNTSESSDGTYICNEVFYLALWLTNKNSPHMYASFIHIPKFKQVSKNHSLKVLTTYLKYIIEKKNQIKHS